MTILSPSTLETTTYGVDGWNAINNSNWQKINDGLGTLMNDIAGKTAEIQIKSSDNTSGTEVFSVVNSDATELFKILADGSIQIGNATNNVTIDNDGNWVLNGGATRWEDLRIPITATKTGGSKDPGFTLFKNDGGASQGVFCYWFDPNNEEELYFVAQVPHAWKLESTLYPHVHWTPKTTADGTPANQKVKWGLEYALAKIGGTFGNTQFVYGTNHFPEDANVVAGKHYLTALSSISMSGIDGVSPMLICRIFRMAADGADTYEHDAGLLEFDFHFEVDTPGGSKEETEK